MEPAPLSLEVLRARAGRVRLVVTDCDGVLTDAGVYYSQEGEALKRFSMRDGMGVERLRNAGVDVLILTGETTGFAQSRAQKLGIVAELGSRDKGGAILRIAAERGLDMSALAYIGDDVNDLPAMVLVQGEGLTGAPADALPEVRTVAHYRCDQPGGHGAFREFAEWILRLRSP